VTRVSCRPAARRRTEPLRDDVQPDRHHQQGNPISSVRRLAARRLPATQHEVAGRADWLAMHGYRKPHAVALEPLAARSLLRAFVAAEPAGSIAMDQVLVSPGAGAVTLMLPTGAYRLVGQTEAGEDMALGEVHTP
jgi:hypothetical protein